MKKIFLISLLVLAVLAGCKKDDPASECEKNNTGILQVTNTKSNPYDISVEGLYMGRVNPGNFEDFVVDSKYLNIKATQVSGYILYPTIIERSVFIDRCERKVFVLE